jgi:predicted membrane channel-forming protein YqfA (hemolysin III family)
MILGAYLCCAIAGLSRRAALFGMISLGLVIGGLSMPSSWHREPHWYRIILFLEWAPCVWIGWKLRSQRAIAAGPASSAA